MFQPWHILLAALCGMVNQRQQQIIQFQNAQIEALLKKLGKICTESWSFLPVPNPLRNNARAPGFRKSLSSNALPSWGPFRWLEGRQPSSNFCALG